MWRNGKEKRMKTEETPKPKETHHTNSKTVIIGYKIYKKPAMYTL
jgi:hypothetical protein